MISTREACTRLVAMYLALSESTFPTSAVNEGRPSEPGAGWMTSAPSELVNRMIEQCKNGAYPSRWWGYAGR